MHRSAFGLVLAVALVAAAFGVALADNASVAVDHPAALRDSAVAHVFSGATTIDVSAAVYTGYQPCLTVECDQAMEGVQVVFDLDAGDSAAAGSFADNYTSETITFICAYKLQGQWRLDEQSDTTAISGTNAELCCVSLRPGIVGPIEAFRVYVKVSAEQADVGLPYVLTYKGQGVARVTNVSN